MINNYVINNNSINTEKRNQYIDFVRGILIFLVVLGHSIQHIIYHESGFENNFVFKIIYSFHMPLFILIGGYLTYPSLAKSESTVWLKKRLLYLFVPTITWSIIVSLFTFAKSGNYSFSYFINYLFNVNWFITAMLLYSITFTILKKFNLCRNWILISLAIIFIVLPVPIKTLKVVCSFYPFFIIGYLLACNQVKLSLKLKKVYLFLTLIIAVVGICFWNKDTYVYYTPTDISYTGSDLYRLVVGCAVIIIFTLLSKTLYNCIKSKRITTSIVNAGKDTFAIYLIQTAFFYKISSSIDKGILINSIITCLFSLSVFLWPYVIDRNSDKSKICGLVLFGKKVSK